MSFTSQDRLKDALMPIVRASLPAQDIRRQRALDKAISGDGFVKRRAMLPGARSIEDGMVSSATDTNSSTTDYASYLSDVLVLPDGIWRLIFRSGLTGRLSTTSNLNTQLLIDTTASPNYQIPLASGDMATVWQRLILEQVPGGAEIPWALQYRPSAGTATIESGFVDWRVERVA